MFLLCKVRQSSLPESTTDRHNDRRKLNWNEGIAYEFIFSFVSCKWLLNECDKLGDTQTNTESCVLKGLISKTN